MDKSKLKNIILQHFKDGKISSDKMKIDIFYLNEYSAGKINILKNMIFNTKH